MPQLQCLVVQKELYDFLPHHRDGGNVRSHIRVHDHLHANVRGGVRGNDRRARDGARVLRVHGDARARHVLRVRGCGRVLRAHGDARARHALRVRGCARDYVPFFLSYMFFKVSVFRKCSKICLIKQLNICSYIDSLYIIFYSVKQKFAH